HIAGMTPNSFCRYFKQRTGKTLIEFINELRIGQACKLLTESKAPIKEICFECGFHNFVSFHKIFKSITRHTPTAYREAASYCRHLHVLQFTLEISTFVHGTGVCPEPLRKLMTSTLFE